MLLLNLKEKQSESENFLLMTTSILLKDQLQISLEFYFIREIQSLTVGKWMLFFRSSSLNEEVKTASWLIKKIFYKKGH